MWINNATLLSIFFGFGWLTGHGQISGPSHVEANGTFYEFVSTYPGDEEITYQWSATINAHRDEIDGCEENCPRSIYSFTGDATITLTVIDNGTAYVFTKQVTTSPEFDVTLLANHSSVCSGSEVTLNFDAVGLDDDDDDSSISYLIQRKIGNGLYGQIAITEFSSWPVTITSTSTFRVAYILNGDDDNLSGWSNEVTVTEKPRPLQYNLSGGGVICSSNTTFVQLNGSELGVSYQLLKDGVSVNVPINGDGGTLIWQNLNAAGTYSVRANKNGCSGVMLNTVYVDVVPLPQQFTVEGGGSYLSGGNGLPVYISGSEQMIEYELYKDGVPTGEIKTGSGDPLLWPNVKQEGIYTVLATRLGGCQRVMASSASIVILLNPVIALESADGCDTYLTTTKEYTGYKWFLNDIQLPAQNQRQLHVLQNGNYTVEVTLTGVSGWFMSGVFPVSLGVENQNVNFIRNVIVLKDGIKDETALQSLTIGEKEVELNYFDGIGRALQIVQQGSSPDIKDIIYPMYYDSFGRESHVHLAYESECASGLYRSQPILEQELFYQSGDTHAQDAKPYAETIYEPSPLNRVLKQGAPGTAWQPDPDPAVTTDKVIHYSYEVNSGSDSIRLWTVDVASGLPNTVSHYLTGQLTKTVTTDEEGHAVIEFVDKLGQTILKRVQAVEAPNMSTYVSGEWADTYYIYDDFGDLRYVLPPEAVNNIDQYLNGQ